MTFDIHEATERILAGGALTDDEVMALPEVPSALLRDAAAKVTAALMPRRFDSCSIINARSGKCSENCKWCAQSAHYSTGCQEYPMVPHDECMEAARLNHEAGVQRFSLVASGRSVRGKALEKITGMLREIRDKVGITTCASLGLLDAEEMRQLYDSGVRRYHCNLETAPSHFATLCTTHTVEDKLRTIGHAHALGMEVCSGGIIGMGESMRQRAEFAVTLRRARPVSIPLNILSPIPGTPLEKTALISDDEILDTVAIMRLAHPHTVLRFAGGRARLSRDMQLECMRIGITGAIVGDLLTTIASSVAQDRDMVARAGYTW
ncbi:MAG: biotin synthase BioB [Muribaculaceae bacterium]|nr:biotin synthase BioB [Muribaculaceae bacterium]